MSPITKVNWFHVDFKGASVLKLNWSSAVKQKLRQTMQM